MNSQIEYIMNDIRAITENVIIKMNDKADEYETFEISREADKYIAAMNGKDIFSSYKQYDRMAINKAGITNPLLIEEYHEDKYKIPYIKRQEVLKHQREIVIEEYVEMNDYYRNLIGMPPVDTPEDEFIYLTQEEMDYYHIDEVRPIHDYPKEIQIKLERVIIPALIEKYPEREYLRHMGSKSVNLVRARQAKNFEIIFSDIILDNVFLRVFFETYDFCREYFMAVIYNPGFKGRYELYDNFIAMNIMIMTIQRLIVDTIKISIDRDYYDLNSIKKLFDCYGVPFFEDLPLDYQRVIVKNINLLLRTKSTDKCLYNILDMMMYDKVKVYKYYLVKERLMDENGEPITVYKKEVDEYGEEKEVLDYEKMYDIYFQSTDIMEPNVMLAIESKQNKYYYDEVTVEDVHWWESEELIKEKYERQYNTIETKYLGINLMQNLTKLMYETTYFIHMLVDNKDTTTPFESRILNSDAMKTGTDYLFITLERFSNVPISIFDAVVMMCALVCKKNHMKGKIITEHAGQILSVLGFNFEANFDLIRSCINKYKYHFKDKSILKYLDLLDIRVVDDIETLYNNFKNFAEFCKERVANTEDIREYKAYKELYKVFTVREEVGEAFTKSNGEKANTYMEYLYDKLPHIAEFIEDLHEDKLGVYIEHILGKLNELIPDLEYISFINGTNNNVMNALISLINFFKSYTTDLRNLNVIYMLDDKFYNKIRMVDDPRFFIKMQIEQKEITYEDYIKNISVYIDKDDKVKLYYKNELINKLLNEDKLILDHVLTMTNKQMYEDVINTDYDDNLHLSININEEEDIKFKHFEHMCKVDNVKDIETITDDHEIDTSYNVEDRENLIYGDLIKDSYVNIDNNEDIFTLDYFLDSSENGEHEEEIIIKDKEQVNKKLWIESQMKSDYTDTIKNNTTGINCKETFKFRDTINIIREE